MAIPFETSRPLERIESLAHGFFGRRGGVSTGDFASLNMSEAGGDDLNHVATNRAQALGIIGFSADRLASLRQVHSIRVETVTGPSAVRPEADALVTNTSGIVLGILTADCAPILYADPEARIIGAAHAGWKGATGGIAEATIAAMEALGARRHRVVAAIGPTISGPNYEVGPDYARQVLEIAPDAAPFFTIPPGGREHFDLPGFLEYRLGRLGLAAVDNLAICTYADPSRWFSHRYATHQGIGAGRQMAMIALR
jgi:YfiH family protein